MPESTEKPKITRYPVVSHSAEYLVIGHLMRRNILAYKAPPNNEGYDLICIHPNPRKKSRPIRIQVKSRLATDCVRAFPVHSKTFGTFDFLIAVFLNVDYYFHKAKAQPAGSGKRPVEFFTFPVSFIRRHHNRTSTWEKVVLSGIKLDKYLNDDGFEQIADELKVKYPSKKRSTTSV